MASESEDPFDVYSDNVQIAISPFDVQLLVMQNKATMKPSQENQAGQPQIQFTQIQLGTLRFSLEHAKVIAILLKRNLMQYQEQANTKIAISPQVSKSLELGENEDW